MMGEFTWGNFIALCMLLFTGLSALMGVWWRMHLSIRAAEERLEQRLREMESAAQERRARVERELNDLRIHVAERYASWDTVKEIETRLGKRMDVLSEQFTNIPDVLVERIMKFLDFKK